LKPCWRRPLPSDCDMTTVLLLAAQAAATAPAKAAFAAPADAMKAAAPTITSIVVNNAFNFVAAIIILIIGWTLAVYTRRWIRSAFARYHHVLDLYRGRADCRSD
jgi:hypothetical protein